MPEVTIRSMDQDEDFAAWLTELLEREADEAGLPSGFDDRYIGLADPIGDWLGWNIILRRPRYMNERNWTLMEKRLPQ